MLPTRLLLPALAAVLVLAGCATNLSTLQTADTLEPFQVRVAAGGGAYVPVGRLAEARALADGHAADIQAAEQGTGQVPDEATRREIITLAASLAVLPPAPVVEASGRLGLFKGFDVGFDWSTSAWRFDGKLGLYGQQKKHGFKAAILAGVEVFTFDVSLWDLTRYLERDVSPVFQYVRFDNPQRYDADAAVLFSWDMAGLFIPYLALKYRAGFFRLPTVITVTTPDETFVHEETLSGVAHFGGATFGLAVGPKLIRLYLELTAAMATARTTVTGEKVELGGSVVYPAAGLSITLF